MTDEKVKLTAEDIERLRWVAAHQPSDVKRLIHRCLYDRDALQAERDKLAGEVERLSKSPWITEEGFRDTEDLLDMGRVGQSLMDAIASCVHKTPGYEHWSPADDPAEIVVDLLNGLADEQIAHEAAEAKLTALVEALEAARDALDAAYQRTGHADDLAALHIAAQALDHHSAPVEEAPIPMLLFCPKCGVQHVDAPEFVSDPGGGNLGVAMKIAADREGAWTNPPHRSHLCHACGCIWRPADVPTEGVATITTKGSADNWTAPPSTPTSAPVEDVGAYDGARWVFWNPDTGQEIARDHPVDSGEVPDAMSIRRSTSLEDALADQLSALIQPQGEERS